MGASDATEGERRARAVVGVMSEAITRGELEDVSSQLPKDFGDLFTANLSNRIIVGSTVCDWLRAQWRVPVGTELVGVNQRAQS